MKTIIVFALLLAFSGCICCPIDLSALGAGDFGGFEGEDVEFCVRPYIQVGSECCLDANDNGICDRDEAVSESTTSTTAPEPSTSTTVYVQATSTTQTTSTTLAFKASYECVRVAGFDPDSVYYLYSKVGRGCGSDPTTTNAVKTSSSRTGVNSELIDITVLGEDEMSLLECFFGPYSPANPNFRYCPQMLCPKNGRNVLIDGRRPLISQMTGFMEACR
jgi:hypothetical protein